MIARCGAQAIGSAHVIKEHRGCGRVNVLGDERMCRVAHVEFSQPKVNRKLDM